MANPGDLLTREEHDDELRVDSGANDGGETQQVHLEAHKEEKDAELRQPPQGAYGLACHTK